MLSKNFIPKVGLLEHLNVEFDDVNALEGQGSMPIVVNSSRKFDVGPTNNARSKKKKQ